MDMAVSKLKRLGPEDWIHAALDALYAEGESGVRVERLAKKLGVTKGSFYWHFRDADDLKQAAIAGWRKIQLALVDGLRQTSHQSEAERLRALIDFTIAKDSRHDIGIRAWGLVNSEAKKAVADVDAARLSYIEGIFSRLGFEAEEAEARARMLYYYQVGDYSVAKPDSFEARKRHARRRARILLQKPE